MMKHAILPLLMAIVLTGCPKPKVPEPKPDPNAATCETVCAHWADLGCEEAEPTPAGESCVAVCNNLQKGNMPDDLECQAAVKSCDEIDSC